MSTASTENGSRVSPPLPRARSELDCSAPSRSAGCTLVPASDVRLSSCAITSTCGEASSVHAALIVRYSRPYNSLFSAYLAYSAGMSCSTVHRPRRESHSMVRPAA